MAVGRVVVDAEPVLDHRHPLHREQPVGERAVRADLAEQPPDLVALLRGHRDAAGQQAADDKLHGSVQLGDREQLPSLGERVVVDASGQRQQEVV
ncbi:MAG: hypothetical protein HOV94_43805 [Saccharothrix sp.]|nr:hypothetical protein [Saccharothrix sp.]